MRSPSSTQWTPNKKSMQLLLNILLSFHARGFVLVGKNNNNNVSNNNNKFNNKFYHECHRETDKHAMASVALCNSIARRKASTCRMIRRTLSMWIPRYFDCTMSVSKFFPSTSKTIHTSRKVCVRKNNLKFCILRRQNCCSVMLFHPGHQRESCWWH